MPNDITRTIPSSIAQDMKLPPDIVREELTNEQTLSLYQRVIITSAQVCRLSGLDRFQFEELLWKRHIPLHYLEDYLDQDIKYATGNLC